MPEDTTRREFLVAAGAGVTAAVAGCSSNPPSQEGTTEDTETDADTETGTDEPTATATPEEEKDFTGGTLKMASPGPVQTLDPVNAKGSGAGYNQYQESLMSFPNGDLPPEPSLAEDYSVSNGGKTYTFKLKEGVTFHDGQELTASDFVYSWERLAGSVHSRNADDIVGETFRIAHEGNTSESVQNYKPGTLAVEAPSKYEFEFTLDTAFHGAISQIAGGAFGVIPEGSVTYPEDYDKHGMDSPMYEGEYDYNTFFSTKGDGPKFVGTGPFKVEAWSKGDQIKLSRYEDYHGEGPYIDAITYTVISSASTRFKRFKNGNLDILNDIPTAKFDPSRRSLSRDRGDYQVGTYDLETGETVNYGQATILDTDYIVFNCQRTERPARRAFAYMINQHDIAQSLYKGIAEPAYHLTPPPVYMAQEGETPATNYDKHAQNGFRSELEFGADGYPYGYDETRIQDAKQVMEDAGYGPNDMYEVEFTVFSGNDTWDSLAKRIQNKARAAHIDVSITKADFGTIISKAIKGKMDMFSLGDGMEWPESDNFLRFLHPYQDPSFMFTRWTTRDVVKGVQFGGDDPETVAENVRAELSGVPSDHISASPTEEGADTGTVAVYIEDTSAEDLRPAMNAAGYSFESIQEGKLDLTKYMKKADEAWNQYYVPNKGPGEEAQKKRDKAYTIIEEVNWASVQELPTVHTRTQRLWSQDVDIRMAGTMENQTFNTLTIDRE